MNGDRADHEHESARRPPRARRRCGRSSGRATVHPERRAEALRRHQQAGDQRRLAARRPGSRAAAGASRRTARRRRGTPSPPRPRSRAQRNSRTSTSGESHAPARGTTNAATSSDARATSGSQRARRVEACRASPYLAEPEHDRARRPATAAAAPASRASTARPSPRAADRAPGGHAAARASSRPTIPIGRLTRKIQRQRQVRRRSAPPMHRAEHRREQHRHADDAHHPPMRLRPRGLGERDHPDRHDHAAGEALEHAEGDQRLGAPRQAAQRARHDERADGASSTPAAARSARPPTRSAGSPSRARAGSRSRPTGSSTAARRGRRASVSSATLTIVVSRIDMIAPTITTTAIAADVAGTGAVVHQARAPTARGRRAARRALGAGAARRLRRAAAG